MNGQSPWVGDITKSQGWTQVPPQREVLSKPTFPSGFSPFWAKTGILQNFGSLG